MKKSFKLLPFITLFFVLSCSKEDDSPSCEKIKIVDFDTESTSIELNIYYPNSTNSAKIEYGLTGFTPGTGTVITTSETYYKIDNLNHSTTYDLYITGICSSSETSLVTKLTSVTTKPSQCTGTVSADFYQMNTQEFEVYCSYSDGSPSYYEAEYGITGFSLGTGTRVQSDYNTIQINNTQPSTTYDVYVRAVCNSSAPTDTSDYTKYTYTTIFGCPSPLNLHSYVVSGSCSGIVTRSFSWSYLHSPQPTSYTFTMVVEGENPETSNHYTTSSQSITITGYCLWDAFYVRANCQNGQSSDWAGPYYF